MPVMSVCFGYLIGILVRGGINWINHLERHGTSSVGKVMHTALQRRGVNQ